MNLRIFAIIVALMIALTCPAQVTTEQARKSREILNKARSLDHLTHLLPLLMTKDQINKLLAAIEKARAKEDKISLDEHNELKAMESKIDKEVERGVKSGSVPDSTVMKDLAKQFLMFQMRRAAIAGENEDALLAAIKLIFNAGQLKTAENTIDPKAYDPTAKPETMSQDDKLRWFIKSVLMDWTCYDVLVKMAAIAH